jgi:hypothetical protein
MLRGRGPKYENEDVIRNAVHRQSIALLARDAGFAVPGRWI